VASSRPRGQIQEIYAAPQQQGRIGEKKAAAAWVSRAHSGQRQQEERGDIRRVRAAEPLSELVFHPVDAVRRRPSLRPSRRRPRRRRWRRRPFSAGSRWQAAGRSRPNTIGVVRRQDRIRRHVGGNCWAISLTLRFSKPAYRTGEPPIEGIGDVRSTRLSMDVRSHLIPAENGDDPFVSPHRQ
jgi:hypothetical protein